MPRSVMVPDSFAYPRQIGRAPFKAVVVNFAVHAAILLVVNQQKQAMGPFMVYGLVASFFAVHGWMVYRCIKDPFCQYGWLNWVMPPDYTKFPMQNGLQRGNPQRGFFWQRSKNLGGSAGRRFTP